MIFNTDIPDFRQNPQLTMQHETVIDSSIFEYEQRTNLSFRPKFYLTYSYRTAGVANVVKRRFQAERELTDHVVVPVWMMPLRLTALDPNSIDISSTTQFWFRREGYIYVPTSGFHKVANVTDESIGLHDALPFIGEFNCYPAIICRKDNLTTKIKDESRLMREEVVKWSEV